MSLQAPAASPLQAFVSSALQARASALAFAFSDSFNRADGDLGSDWYNGWLNGPVPHYHPLTINSQKVSTEANTRDGLAKPVNAVSTYMECQCSVSHGNPWTNATYAVSWWLGFVPNVTDTISSSDPRCGLIYYHHSGQWYLYLDNGPASAIQSGPFVGSPSGILLLEATAASFKVTFAGQSLTRPAVSVAGKYALLRVISLADLVAANKDKVLADDFSYQEA